MLTKQPASQRATENRGSKTGIRGGDQPATAATSVIVWPVGPEGCVSPIRDHYLLRERLTSPRRRRRWRWRRSVSPLADQPVEQAKEAARKAGANMPRRRGVYKCRALTKAEKQTLVLVECSLVKVGVRER